MIANSESLLKIRFENVVKLFYHGDSVTNGLQGVDLTVPNGKVQVWLGPSGCGKSTTARVLVGLEIPEQGKVYFDDRQLIPERPHVRCKKYGLYYTFQTPTLYPHLNVRENITFGTKSLGLSRAEIDDRMNAAVQILFPDFVSQTDLQAFYSKKQNQLSGGELQRVSLVKAIIRRAPVTILDEPLNSVDAQLRITIRRNLKRWLNEHKITCIWVTHDHNEAVAVADTVVVFDKGRILQQGTVEELYTQPNHLKVASFIAEGVGDPFNFLEVDLITGSDGMIKLRNEFLHFGPFNMQEMQEGISRCTCAIPSTGFDIQTDPFTGAEEATIDSVERDTKGPILFCKLRNHQFFVRATSRSSLKTNDILWLRPSGKMLLFDIGSGKAISFQRTHKGSERAEGLNSSG